MQNDSQQLSTKIAQFALSMKLSQVPENIIEHGKMLLTDTFGVAMSCQDLAHADAVRKTITQNGTAPQCTLWGSNQKVMLADAVLYNSSLIHGADYDDTHVGSIVHPSAAVVSTAITVGELVEADGAKVLEAIIVGWEIIIRLGLAAKGRFHDVGFHGTGIVSSFAATCVAAKLFGDSEDTLVNALGICGSQSAAIQEFLKDGTWVKKIHPGWAAHSGIYALSLARNGFKGPGKVFEGEFGMWMTHCGGTDGLEEAFLNLGTHWHTSEITVKLYPVCHMTHSFIDCMVELIKEQNFTANDISLIECRIEKRCYHIVCTPKESKIRPNTEYTMRFSLPYVIAIAAIKQRVSPWEVDLKYAEDPQVCSLMDKINCIEDESKKNSGYFPGWLKVTLKDGRIFTKEQPWEMGTKENPLNMEAVKEKLMNNLQPFYTEKQIREIISNIQSFEKLSNMEEFIQKIYCD